jgi:hypothetical protein
MDMKKKYAKGGMHKMPDGKMMKNSAMKKGGMAKKPKGKGLAIMIAIGKSKGRGK